MTESGKPPWGWIIPVAVGVLVCVCVGLRTPAGPERPVVSSRRPTPAESLPAAEPDSMPVARSEPPPVVETDDRENEREADGVLLRTTYQNFRTAVASDNLPLQQALKPALARRHRDALNLAQEESQHAATPLDREIARRTLEALRN